MIWAFSFGSTSGRLSLGRSEVEPSEPQGSRGYVALEWGKSLELKGARRSAPHNSLGHRRPETRAPHSCIAYAARSWNHPAMFSRVTSCKAEPNAAETVSFVRAAADRSDPLTFENISAIGVRSGLHGGSGTTSAPAASTASIASSD